VGEVTTEDLLSADGVIVGSPVYFGSMSGEVKTFFDNWLLKFGVFRELKMRNKVGGAFVTGGAISNGKRNDDASHTRRDAYESNECGRWRRCIWCERNNRP
jgi:multimeric flavodoxin WrbA